MAEDAQPKGRLPGAALAALLCFWLPGALVQLATRLKLYLDREALGLAELGAFELFYGDVTFHAGLLCLIIALLGALHQRSGAWLLQLPIYLFCAFQICLSLATAHFFRVTGTPLDFPLVYFGLSDLYTNWELLHSEVSLWAMPLALGGAALLTWLAARLGRWLGGQPLEPRRARLWAAGGVALLALSATPLDSPNQKLLKPPIWAVVSTMDSISNVKFYREERETVERLKALSPQQLSALRLESDTTQTVRVTPAPELRRRNVVFFIYESTSHFDTTLYDPSLDTTPTLAALAHDRSIWAPRAYAVVPHTSKALVAIFCGVEPHLTLPITEAERLMPLPCLPNILRELGWATASFQTSNLHFERWGNLVKNLGFEKAFSVADIDKERWERSNYFGRDDRSMLQPSVEWARAQRDAGKPFLISILTLAPHHDYKLPSAVKLKTYDGADELKNLHLNGVRYIDAMLADLIAQFKEHGLYEDTIFVLLGDHGEAFGEHLRFQHDNVIYEEGLRIPMLIHDPGLSASRRVEPRASQLDLTPTLLGLLGLKPEPDHLSGDDLRALNSDRPIRAHCWFERHCMASIFNDIKYIHHFDNTPDEVFDLSADPHERHDLAAQRPEIIAERRPALRAWRSWVNYLWQKRFEQGRAPQP